MSSAALTPMPPFASSAAACCFRSIGPPPSGLPTTVVTPCATSGRASRRLASVMVARACECTSMNPGATIRSLASMTVAAAAAREPSYRDDPIAADADVGAAPGIAGAVHQPAADDQDVVTGRRLCEGRRGEGEQNGDDKEEPCAHGAILAQTRLGWPSEPIANTAGLRHVSDERTPGIRRVGSPARVSLRAAQRPPRYLRRPSWRGSRRSSSRRRGETSGFARIRAVICRRPGATRAAASNTGITRDSGRCAKR